MKVTISAPFGRVQVELSAGETAQLMLDAVGMAEHRQRILEATEEKTGDESEDIATPVCALARNDADILKVSNAGVEDENGG